MSSEDIKRYELSIEPEEGKKPKRIVRKKLSSSDFGKTFTHKIYLDFISDGVPKQEYGEISVKVGEQIPVNKPPVVTINSSVTVKPNEEVSIVAMISDPEGGPITVTWEQTGGTVDFQQGNEGSSFWIKFTSPPEDTELTFRVTTTDDKGAVSYGNVTVKVRKEPEPEPKPKLKVGQIGDLHGEHNGIVLLKTREQCDLVICTGDITDTETDDDGYIDAVNGAGYKYGEDLLNAQANHESSEEGGEGAQQDMENAFPILNETQWLQFLVKENVCVIVNNTQIDGYSQKDSVAAGHIQKSLAKLRELRDAGTVDWAIFMQHKPMYSLKGGHDPEYNFRYNFHKDLDDAGVNFFINGHIHNIQRTVPILYGGEGTNIPPIINNKMIGDAHDMSVIPHGLICIVNGSSTKSHSLSEDSNPWTPFARDDTNSYTIFEFNGKNCTVKFVDIDSGSVQHEFKVTKGEGEPEPEKPVIRVTAPSQIKPAEVGTIDASQSTADNVTMISREALPLTPVAQWVNTFAAPNQENLNLQFTVDATKGTYSASQYVNVHVASEIPVDYDSFGMKLLMKTKVNKVAMEWGSDHSNGQRFNVNHKFENHMMQGYYKLGEGQEKIETKEDGPNHGSCDFFEDQICFWWEAGLILATGSGQSQYEWHHADNFPIEDSKNEVIDSVGQLKAGNWVGWASACYWDKNDGLRHYKAWCDPNPFANNDPNTKPLNNWKLVIHLIHTADLITEPRPITIPRDMQKVINYDRGFECEIRMHRATNHDTDMKNAWVFEIEP